MYDIVALPYRNTLKTATNGNSRHHHDEVAVDSPYTAAEIARNLARARAQQRLVHLLEEVHHVQRQLESWQQSPVDAISLPTLGERGLPLAMGAAVLWGVLPRAGEGVGWWMLGAVLLGLFYLVRTQRRQHAQVRRATILARWQSDLEQRQIELERHRRAYMP